MFEIIGTLMTYSSFIWGICVGSILTVFICVIALWFDHKRNMTIAKERIWNGFAWDEILIANSYWDQRQCMEIILSEV